MRICSNFSWVSTHCSLSFVVVAIYVFFSSFHLSTLSGICIYSVSFRIKHPCQMSIGILVENRQSPLIGSCVNLRHFGQKTHTDQVPFNKRPQNSISNFSQQRVISVEHIYPECAEGMSETIRHRAGIFAAFPPKQHLVETKWSERTGGTTIGSGTVNSESERSSYRSIWIRLLVHGRGSWIPAPNLHLRVGSGFSKAGWFSGHRVH